MDHGGLISFPWLLNPQVYIAVGWYVDPPRAGCIGCLAGLVHSPLGHYIELSALEESVAHWGSGWWEGVLTTTEALARESGELRSALLLNLVM